MTKEAPPFVVMGLPRSRTAWLSQFLSYGGWHCGHDQLRYMRSLDDVKAWLSQSNTGTCETGAAPFWRLLKKYCPDVRVVTIRRPVEESTESLIRTGFFPDGTAVRKLLAGLDRKLDQVEGRMTNVRSFRFDDLKNERACAELFGYCLLYPHDPEWWRALSAVNIQFNFPALVRYIDANRPAINKLIAQAREAMFRDLAIRPVDMESVVIKEEDFDTAVRDCGEMFRRHCSDVGEHPDNWLNKNLPLMKKLHDMGMMQILIARSNGRVFGYLMSFLCPSLEAADRTMAQHTMFYAARECPGLGLKLQRAALEPLRKKGAQEVFMRDAHRGDAKARIGTLYRRIGAEDFGHVYRIGLEA